MVSSLWLFFIVIMIVLCVVFVFFFFFKQKTAYEMRISDWSSDVCSSDLPEQLRGVGGLEGAGRNAEFERVERHARQEAAAARIGEVRRQIGRASCRERVCQYV